MFMPFDQPDGDGRIYKYESIDISEYQHYVNNDAAIGEFYVIDRAAYLRDKLKISLMDVSHKIIKVEKTKEGIVGIVKLLDTPKGNLVKELLDNGVNLSIRPRCVGFIDLDKIVHVKKIISFDFVNWFNDSMNPLSYRNKRYKFNKGDGR